MLCIPVTNDQPGLARRVEWLGAGEVLKPNQATAARVRALVKRLLAGTYAEAARRCGDRFQASPGVERAADIVESAFRTRKRVERSAFSAALFEESAAVADAAHGLR